jgi:hypothetical protein
MAAQVESFSTSTDLPLAAPSVATKCWEVHL